MFTDTEIVNDWEVSSLSRYACSWQGKVQNSRLAPPGFGACAFPSVWKSWIHQCPVIVIKTVAHHLKDNLVPANHVAFEECLSKCGNNNPF